MTHTVTSFKEKVYFITRIVVAVGAIVALLALAHNVLFLIFGGILIALLFDGGGQLLRRGIDDLPPHASALLAGFLIIAGLALLTWLLGIQIGNQLGQVGPRITDALNQLSNSFPSITPFVETVQSKSIGELLGSSGVNVGNITNVLTSTATIVTNTIFLVLLAFFFAAAPGSYRKQALPFVPEEHEEKFRKKIGEMGAILKRWLVGKLISMAIVGVLTAIGLWALGVPLPLALALIAFLTAFIPNLGPIIAVVPAVLIAFTVSPMTALWTLLLYIGIQFVESNLITPNIQSRAVSIAPGFILSGQLLLGALFGLPGLALATPLIAAGSVLVKKEKK